ncbi:MAG TPA: hypothetical protein VFH24_08325 [Gemmatimonadales bacterium]|nr:hypothetical protein [Gemmatimonadales bacterium]
MVLLFAFFVVGISLLACFGLSTLVGRDLYWPMAAAWALWAARDAKTHNLQRFERVFPLEPRALFLAVLLLWPVALPWYLRLKDLALLGVLREPRNPSRSKYALLAIAVVLPLAWYGGTRLVGGMDLLQDVQKVQEAVAAGTTDAVTVTLHTNGTVTIMVQNSATSPAQPIERETLARRLASAAVGALPDSTHVGTISVQFTSVERRGGITVTRPEQVFNWPVSELRCMTPAGAPRVSAGQGST